jgi:hypothetical protein
MNTSCSYKVKQSPRTAFGSSAAYIQKANQEAYTECRLLVHKLAVAGFGDSLLILSYSTVNTQTAGDYSAASAEDVSENVNVVNDFLASDWKPLATLAQADVFITVIGTGGNGTIDPQFGQIVAEFR